MGGPARHSGGRGRPVLHPPRPGPDLTAPLPGSVPSPNIWHHPRVYEVENHATDPERRIETAMRSIAPWDGKQFLDLGCGNGFHLPRWAEAARDVVGVEPHPDLAAVATRRVRRLPQVRVLTGTAQQIPLPDASVDVAQARLAYFFGPGSEPGVAELGRVVRPGGTAFVIDNDATRSTFGRWFARGFPMVDADAVEGFWARHGWQRVPLDIVWRFGSRADLESVVRIELPRAVAESALAEHGPDAGLEIDYAVNLWWRTFD